MTEKDWYEMKIDDRKILRNWGIHSEIIIRVPGGWIYKCMHSSETTCCFIPFYQEPQKPQDDIEHPKNEQN